MKLKIFSKKEKQRIVDKLKRQFGVESVEGIFVRMGKERLFLFQGSFNKREIFELTKIAQIERLGVYFGKEIMDKIRLSIEGAQLLKNQITKNIFELNNKQAEQWMKGQELLWDNMKTSSIQKGGALGSSQRGFLIIKYKNNFLGCGKASEHKIGNYIPKSRRLKEKG